MGNEAVFTLTFKTILDALGINQLNAGVQAGKQKIEDLNSQLRSTAASTNAALVAPGTAATTSLGNAKNQATALVNELGAGNEAAGALGQSLGLIGNPIAIAVVLGLSLNRLITHAADESLRLAQEIAKGTDEMVKHVREWNQLAKAAGDFGDVANLAGKIQPALDALEAKTAALRARELTGWQKFVDGVTAIWSAVPGWGPRVNQAALDAERKAYEELTKSEVAFARSRIDAAQKAADAEQQMEAKPLLQSIIESTDKVDALKAKLAGINTGSVGGSRQFLEVAEDLKLAEERLKSLKTAEATVTAETENVRAAIATVGFEKLDSTHKLDALNSELLGIQDKLRQVGVEAATPNEALEKAATLTKEDESEVIKLASAWGRVIAQIEGVVEGQTRVNAQLEALRDKESVLNAQAYGTRSEAYNAEWGAKYNTILREREKIGADTSSSSINSQIAAEEKAAEKRKQWAAEDNAGSGRSRASSDALADAKFRLTSAEQSYRQSLEEVSLLEHSGAISSGEAEQRKIQAARAYLAELQRQRAELPALIAQMQKLGDVRGVDQLKLEFQRLGIEVTKVKIQMADDTFLGKIRSQMRTLTTEWGDLGKQIGGFLTQQFQNFANTAASVLTGLIFRTGNWKQAIQQLGQSFVQSMLQMVIQWILSRTIMSALNKAFGAADQAAAGAQASSAAAAWAPAATAASIASYGVAAGLGVTAFLSALGVGTAGAVAASAGGGFQEGGYTGAGPESGVAGHVHFGEVVFPSARVRELGKDWLVNMAIGSLSKPGYQRGGFVGASGGAGGGSLGRGFASSAKPEVHIALFDDRQKLAKWLSGREGGKIIIDTVSGRRIDLGL